jgi:16S rRNA (cytosine967-C5)-methyltransferase
LDVTNPGAASPPGLAARSAALAVLGEVLRRHRPLDAALDGLIPSQLSARDRGFARAIASETFRRYGQIDALLRTFLAKSPQPHRSGRTLDILLAGACELLFLDVAPHAAVDAANQLAAADSKAVHFKPLINATLRRISREGASIVAGQDAERLNTPDWLWGRWCAAYGEVAARAIAFAHRNAPPLDLMVKMPAAGDAFRSAACALPGNMMRLFDPGPIEALPGYADGAWWVQDFAASLPVRLLGDVRGKRVLDLCAAPGGKTAQLAAAGADVVAVEREPQRLDRLRGNLSRLKLSAEIVEANVQEFATEARAEMVLLDAPCSATGTIRRHPELPWIKSAADVTLCAQNAGDMLEACAAAVMPGGVLVFAVCSLEYEECEGQIGNFLRRHDEFRREPIAPAEVFDMKELVSVDGDLRTLPCHLADRGGMDGFYAARLRRSG